MSIKFKQAIIHNLDASMSMPILSKECMGLTDDTESFIARKIIKVLGDPGICEGKFKEQLSFYEQDQLYYMFKNWDDSKFKMLSEKLAELFYSYILSYGNIASGDLIVANYLIDSKEYVAVLKVNFNQGDYTHYYSQDDEVMKLIANKIIYSEKVIEAAIICTEDASIKVLDGTKSKYLQLLLDVDTELSVKDKLKVFDSIAGDVVYDHYDNPIKALGELKTNINESLAQTNSINVVEVVEKTFGECEEVTNSFKQRLEECGLNDEQPINVSGSKLFNKYAKQKLKTDTGIEIKMPTPLFSNADFFQMVDEADGTKTLIIKNISQVISK